MPWEYLAGSVAGAVFSKALDMSLEKAQPATRVFVERMSVGFSGTLAERYLRLSSQDLIAFYSKENPIEMTLAGNQFVLPVSLAWDPNGRSGPEDHRLTFFLSSEPFRLEALLDSYVQPVKRRAARDKRLFDGVVVRLAALTNIEAKTVVSLCPASYFDALATNFAMDHQPQGRSETLRELLHGGVSSLGDFSDSGLVNHIGVVCMLETSDGMIVGQRRSAKVANRPKSLSASVSGAANFTDIRSYANGSGFQLSKLASAIFREAAEELGVDLKRLRCLGLVREFLRGGQPELYFYARSEESLEELNAMLPQVEGRAETRSLVGFEFHSERVGRDDDSRYSFQKRVQTILTKNGDSANLTFIVGTLLASKAVLRGAT